MIDSGLASILGRAMSSCSTNPNLIFTSDVDQEEAPFRPSAPTSIGTGSKVLPPNSFSRCMSKSLRIHSSASSFRNFSKDP